MSAPHCEFAVYTGIGDPCVVQPSGSMIRKLGDPRLTLYVPLCDHHRDVMEQVKPGITEQWQSRYPPEVVAATAERLQRMAAGYFG